MHFRHPYFRAALFLYIISFPVRFILLLICFITASVDIHAFERVAPSDSAVTVLKLPGKKGACFTLRSTGDPKGGTYLENMPRVLALKPAWNYSWGSDLAPNQPESIEFIPMQWGSFAPPPTALYDKIKPLIQNKKVNFFLGFNEPDKSDQSNMSVTKALSLWPYLQELNVSLGSPAAANDFGTWFRQFMDSVKVKGYRVDFICYHSYGGPDASAFLNNVKLLYDTYKLPVLITEFAVADWSATSPGNNRYSDAQVMNFMNQVLPALDTASYVLGYAWFPFNRISAAGTHSALFEPDGSLSALGEIYANHNSGSLISGMETTNSGELQFRVNRNHLFLPPDFGKQRTVSLFNIQGRKLFSVVTNEDIVTLPAFPTGTYILNVSAKGFAGTQKIILTE